MMRALKLIIAFACVFAFGSLVPDAQNAPPRGADPFPGWNKRVADTHLDFRHYYPLDEVNSTCEMLVNRFPELLTMKEIGRETSDQAQPPLSSPDTTGAVVSLSSFAPKREAPTPRPVYPTA